jgi:hypothetical protein
MSDRNRTDTREPRIRAAVPCPVCGAAIGEACRQGRYPHDARNGAEDRRPLLHRAHQERRAAWLDAKHAAEQATGAALAAFRPHVQPERSNTMEFRRATGEHQHNANTVELWEGDDTHLATITADAGTIHLVCQPGWQPAGVAIEPQPPTGVLINLRRD